MQFITHQDFPNLFIREHSSDKYPPRTAINAKAGNVTLALALDMNTKGEILTKNLVEKANNIYLGKVLEDNISSHDIARSLYKKLKESGGNQLNIAGNSIVTLKKYGCSQEWINEFVFSIVEKVHTHLYISKIVTGGQTGVDMAGAIAGTVLGIHTEVTFPNGFLQRFEEYKDIKQDAESVFKQFKEQVHNLQKTVGLPNIKKNTP